MKKATLVKVLPPNEAGSTQWLVHVPDGYPGASRYDEESDEIVSDRVVHHVVASAAMAFMVGPEVFLFESNEAGEIVNWTELEGSRRGTLDIEVVLREAGLDVSK